ncbi:CUB and sushi domain-containing protein 1 [Trichonephila clavipes]|nr:CUB and sushi domain-containing protein 1 [Trichonephila clavipes]
MLSIDLNTLFHLLIEYYYQSEKESCPDPGVSIDGKREGDCCYIGDVLEFSCNEDYELVGKDEIICLPGAKWSSPRPLCRRVHWNVEPCRLQCLNYASEDPWLKQPNRDGPTDSRLGLS